MSRRSLSKSQRLDVLHAAGGLCHICGQTINLARGDKMEIEHVIPIALGGLDDAINTRPAHRACHAQKTKSDVKTIAKAKRVKAKHTGQFRPPRHIVPGSKASAFKKTLSGAVILRATGEIISKGWSK